MIARHSTTHSHHTRRGLAPLEFVLSLPLMMAVMGLMVIFGMAGRLKVRSVMNAREAAWQHLGRRFRDGNGLNAPPRGWPRGGDGSVSSGGGGLLTLDRFDNARFDSHRSMQGPVVSGGTSRSIPVDPTRFDAHRGVRQGAASATADYPLLQGNPANPRRLTASRRHLVMDNMWRYYETGVRGNTARRLNAGAPSNPFYRIPRPQSLKAEFRDASEKLLQALASLQPALVILTEDDELVEARPWGIYSTVRARYLDDDYYGAVSSQIERNPPGVRRGFPEAIGELKRFYFDSERPVPGLQKLKGRRPPSISTNQRDRIREHIESMLFDALVRAIHGNYGPRLDDRGQPVRSYGGRAQWNRITGLPGRLTNDFLGMYNRQTSYINGLRRELQSDPPPTQARIDFINREIARFESADPPIADRIDTLNRYRSYLLGVNLSPP